MGIASAPQPGKRTAEVHGDVIGLATLDFVLRTLRARVMDMAFVVDVSRMHADDRAADASRCGIPTHLIADLEPISHRGHPWRPATAPPRLPLENTRRAQPDR